MVGHFSMMTDKAKSQAVVFFQWLIKIWCIQVPSLAELDELEKRKNKGASLYYYCIPLVHMHGGLSFHPAFPLLCSFFLVKKVGKVSSV